MFELISYCLGIVLVVPAGLSFTGNAVWYDSEPGKDVVVEHYAR